MIRNILLLLFTLTVGFVTYADEYIPLVREGVKWVCIETKIGVEEEDFGIRYYTIEIKGDTVADNVTYKKCYRYSDVAWDEDFIILCSKTEPFALLREEGRTVYAYNKDAFYNNNSHSMTLLSMNDAYDNDINEVILYEFDENGRFKLEGYKPFLNQDSEIYSFIDDFYTSNYGIFVEGVGFDSDRYGDLLTPFFNTAFCTCSYQSYIGLHHMEDAEGNIIYRGRAYPSVGDVNGDSMIDVEDVNAAINIILKLKTMDDYPGNADLDGNGIVDVEDMNILINKILKLE